MRRAALSAVAATVLLAACSSKTPAPKASASSTPSVTVSASASPTKKPAHVVSARQALYVYQNAIWLYDVKTNKTRQVTQGGTVRYPKWIDATHFSFIQGENTLKIADLKAATTIDVFTAPGGIQVYGWSPDHQTVAYIETDSSGYPHLRYRSLSDGATQSVTTLGLALGRDGTDYDDVRIEWSKDGAYVLVIYTPSDSNPIHPGTAPPEQGQFQIRGSDGSLVYAPDQRQGATMGLFSRDGKAVYYMASGHIRAWMAGSGTVRDLRNMRWFQPSLSPDGTQVAFSSSPSSVRNRIRILNLRTLTVSIVSNPSRTIPVFAGPRAIWAQGMAPCTDPCPGGAVVDDHVYLIDTHTRSEKLLPITSLLDVDVLYS